MTQSTGVRYGRSAEIRVRIVDGRPLPVRSDEWPTLREGATGRLILPSSAIEERPLRARYAGRASKEILPIRSRLAIMLNEAHVPPSLLDRIRASDARMGGADHDTVVGPLLPLENLEPLVLNLRAAKRSTLRACQCYIPDLRQDASSLNHAYTLVSRFFESSRRSHSGNVFKKVFVQPAGMPYWAPLERLRIDAEQGYEGLLEELVSRAGQLELAL